MPDHTIHTHIIEALCFVTYVQLFQATIKVKGTAHAAIA